MGYATKQIVYFLGSQNAVDQMLLWNNTDIAITGSKFDFFNDSASQYIDSFLRPAGYQVPLASPPTQIQEIAGMLILERLYTHSQQDIPDSIKRQTQAAKATLLGLQDKTISLEGLNQSSTSGIGGHLASDPSVYYRQFSRLRWRQGT